jgi:hypothetical protein
LVSINIKVENVNFAKLSRGRNSGLESMISHEHLLKTMLKIGKGRERFAGLSALGGQAKSVYVRGEIRKEDKELANIVCRQPPTPALAQSGTLELIRDNQNPGGSSTGSALAVAAGYTPISIGGESDGSLTTPASRAALCALKCPPQTISGEGIFLTNPKFETIGGMAKSVRGLIDITQIILQAAKKSVILNVNLRNDFQGLTLGFVNPPKWKLPETLFDSDESYLKQVVRFLTSTQTFAFCTT